MHDQQIPPAAPEAIAALAKALAHPARIRIILFLLSRPGCIGGEIVDQVGLAQSTVSEHLRILKDSGLVQGRIDYPRICYALNPAALQGIRDLIEAIATRSPQADLTCRTGQDALPVPQKGNPNACL